MNFSIYRAIVAHTILLQAKITLVRYSRNALRRSFDSEQYERSAIEVNNK